MRQPKQRWKRFNQGGRIRLRFASDVAVTVVVAVTVIVVVVFWILRLAFYLSPFSCFKSATLFATRMFVTKGIDRAGERLVPILDDPLKQVHTRFVLKYEWFPEDSPLCHQFSFISVDQFECSLLITAGHTRSRSTGNWRVFSVLALVLLLSVVLAVAHVPLISSSAR
jgi:hypothetical protein